MSRIAVAVAAVLIGATPAFAQSRGPVVPTFQQPDKQAAAPAAPPAGDIDLVGPTEAQRARAQAAAEARIKAEAEAKAAADKQARDEAAARLRAQADAMAKADADAKARSDAEAKAKADAADKVRLEAEARVKAEAQARAAAAAEKQRKLDEARAHAAAAVEAAKQKALEAALAHRRALEEARVAARAAAEAKKHAQAEAAAQKRDQSRAKRAEAEAKAKSRALVLARKREEAKCGAGKKAAKCLAAVAARYEAPALPADGSMPGAAPAAELALTPLIAPPPAAAVAAAPAPAAAAVPAVVAPAAAAAPVAPAAVPATSATAAARPAAAPVSTAPVAAAPSAAAAALASRAVAIPNAPVAAPATASSDRRVLVPADAPAPTSTQLASAPVAPIAARPASVRLGSASSAPAASSATVLAIPRDEQPQRKRAAEVVNDLQLGPQSLILDNLSARGEILPGVLQLDFGYRFAIDDAAAPHHLFLAGLESGRCLAGDACGLRWFARGGFGPHNASAYSVDRRVNGTQGTHRDTLGWSSNVLQGGVGYSGATLTALADAQLEGLTTEYLKNIDLAGPPRVNGSLRQLRLRGTVGVQGGGFSAQARVATYAYSGDSTALFKDVPMRGALLEDDMPGLAGALQSLSARLEGRWESAGGFALAASYGYLSYAGPVWSNANIFAGAVSQRFGRFRIGVGIVAEQEADAQGNGYPTVFGTGSVGAAF